MARKNKDWLKALYNYVEDTEAPRDYWLWSGIFTIAATLQRRVWIQYGLENIYPNIYVLVVAPPGERKGAPPTLAKKFLEKIEIPVSVDSSSKRAITEELAEIAKREYFNYDGKPRSMASMAVVSKELSSLLAVDPKGIIEVLTDLYDSHDQWKYKTSKSGEDFLYNVCVSCFLVTTQTWLVNNLPAEAIGGGFTSRFAIVHDAEFYKLVYWPPEPPKQLYNDLITDLVEIRNLVGEFKIDPIAKEVFRQWYEKIPERKKGIQDPRMIPFMNRVHVIALKTAMALRVSYSNDLIITPDDIGRSIDLVDRCVSSGSKALGGHGKSTHGPDVDIIRTHIKTLGSVWFKELLSVFYRNLNKTELMEVVETIEAMGAIKKVPRPEKNDYELIWKGEGR